MSKEELSDLCDDLIDTYNQDKWTTFCFCKHTLEHLGLVGEDYWECLRYIAKKLNIEKEGNNVNTFSVSVPRKHT